MRSLEQILTESLTNWDEKHVSEPVLAAVRELAADGRFEEITLLLNGFADRYGRQALVYSVNHLPGVLLHEYVYGKTEAAAAIVDEYWLTDGAGAAIKDAALKDGRLAAVVLKIICDLNAMAALIR